MPCPTLPVSRTRQQFVYDTFISSGLRVGKKCPQLLSCRRHTDQVEIHTPEQGCRLGFTDDLQLSFLKASVPNCEIPTDHAISAILVRTARRLGITRRCLFDKIAKHGLRPPA